ncbi:MAG: glycosyltransferase, partial [Patescibacteria group bacterium]
MKLTIIINHHRTPETLLKCLEALKKELKSVDYEIIITESEAEEETAGLISRKYPDVLYIGNSKNVGFSKIVNPALEKASGEYLFIINADIIVKNEKSLIDMIDYLEKHEDAGVIGPKLLNIDGSIQQSYFREYTPLTILARRTFFGKTSLGKKYLDWFSYKDKGGLNKPLEVEWLMGSALLLERKRFEK